MGSPTPVQLVNDQAWNPPHDLAGPTTLDSGKSTKGVQDSCADASQITVTFDQGHRITLSGDRKRCNSTSRSAANDEYISFQGCRDPALVNLHTIHI